MIRLGFPEYHEAARDLIESMLERGQLADGRVTALLEDELCSRLGFQFCITVSSGTIALALALENLQAEDVFIPPLVCKQVLNALKLAHKEPYLAGLDETHNLLIPDWGRNGAKIVTHTYGHPASMDEFGENTIEDVSQAYGARFRGSPVGTFGEICVGSTYASKPLGGGRGGFILVDDPSIARRIKEKREEMHCYMSDLDAAVALTRLNYVREEITTRNVIAKVYDGLLGDSVSRPAVSSLVVHAWYKYPVIIKKNQDVFVREMMRRDIEVARMWSLVPKLPVIEWDEQVRWLADHVFCLPMHTSLRDSDIEYVADAVLKFVEEESDGGDKGI
ncbi:MAG: DegT/DnrJ/EryC1/StrS family aminotransferase [Methanosarcinales archaeon]